MNIDHLRLFQRIAITRNISLAGKELGLSPAVASSHINKLEDALGVRLLHRTTRQVTLTEEGRAFLPHAEDVLASMEAARAAVGAGSESPTGTLRLSASASFGRMHLTPALSGFLHTYPGIKLDLRFSDTMIDMVEGGFDVAVRIAALHDSSLIARKLAPDQRIVCASPAFIKQWGEPHSPQALADYPCITLAGLDSWSFKTEAGVATVKVSGPVRADNGEVVRALCEQGLGVAIGSVWNVYEHVREGRLVPILKAYPLVSEAAIWAVYPSSRLLAPKVRAFIDYFSDYFKAPIYWDN